MMYLYLLSLFGEGSKAAAQTRISSEVVYYWFGLA